MTETRREVSTVSWPLVAILAAGLALRLILLPLHGGQHEPAKVAFPAGAALVHLAIGQLTGWISPSAGNAALSFSLLKLPATFADIASAAIAYSIVVRYAPRADALFAAAIACFGPWTWPLSAVAGQVESIGSMFVLLALDFCLDERFTIAWLALAAASLFTPLTLVLVPLLLAAHVRSEGFSVRVVAGPFAGVVLAYVASVPFAASIAPQAVFGWFEHALASSQRHLSPTSFFADNAWLVFAQPVSDAHRIFGIALQTYGWIAFGAIEVVVLAIASRRSISANSRLVRARSIVVAWFVVMFALFVVTTRMHERSLAYALSLTPAIWPIGEWERRVTVLLAGTFSIGLLLSIFVPGHRSPYEIGAYAIVALVNVVTLIYALVRFGATPPAVDEDWGGSRIP